MKSGVFVLKSLGGLGQCSPALDNSLSTLVLYVEHSGDISFLSEVLGKSILHWILSQTSVVDRAGNIVSYNKDDGAKDFLNKILAYGGVCFYRTNDAFVKAAQEMSEYRLALEKQKIYTRYGREFHIPDRPPLDYIVSGEVITEDLLNWLYAHCEQFSIWKCFTGVEYQPLFFGKNQEGFFIDLVNECSKLSVPISIVPSVEQLPNW